MLFAQFYVDKIKTKYKSPMLVFVKTFATGNQITRFHPPTSSDRSMVVFIKPKSLLTIYPYSWKKEYPDTSAKRSFWVVPPAPMEKEEYVKISFNDGG